MIKGMNYSTIIFLLGVYFLATSCEKVINLDIKTTDPLPVFESYIENDSFCYAKVTWTTPHHDNAAPSPVTTALITITDQLAQQETLVHQGNGIYKGNSLKGKINNSYTLSATINNQTFTAKSTMPALVSIDTIIAAKISTPFQGNSDGGRRIFVHYTDPVDQKNYYGLRVTFTYSPEDHSTYHHSSDALSNGKMARFTIAEQEFWSGSTVNVEFINIDQATHLYFKTIQNASLNAGFIRSTPANPTTNFSKGALGYFSARSKDKKGFTVP